MTLTLSRCCPGDRADFIGLELDPEVMHFLNGSAVDHEKTDPKNVTFLMPRGSEPHVWTARRTATNAFVGWFCLFPETKALAEIGFRLRRGGLGSGISVGRSFGSYQLGFQQRRLRREPRLAPRVGKDRNETRPHRLPRLSRRHPGRRGRRSLVRIAALGVAPHYAARAARGCGRR